MASNIVEHEIRHKEILQSSFDLLGEMVKFNLEAFKTFDEILVSQDKVQWCSLFVTGMMCPSQKENNYVYLFAVYKEVTVA